MNNKVGAAALAMFIATGGAVMMMNQPIAQTSGGQTKAIKLRCPSSPASVKISSESLPVPTDYLTRYSVITCINTDGSAAPRKLWVGDKDVTTVLGYPLFGGPDGQNNSITVAVGSALYCTSDAAPGEISCIATLH